MAITLERIPAPGATPVTNNSASSKSFANDYYKVNEPNISMRERMTVAIIGLIHTVSAANYKSNHKGLVQDAMVYTRGISQEFDLFSALASIDWTNGNEVDATLSSDLPTILKEGRDLANYSEDELKRIYVFLRAQLLT